jgi:hypothetical protein
VRTLVLLCIAFLLVLAGAPQAQASPLSNCLADNTTGKERKDLARWVFLAMAAHPEMERLMTPSAASERDAVEKSMAALLVRLVAESCLKETQAAYKEGGSQAMEAAFQTLGALAMQELMTNDQVKVRMSSFEKYLDQKKLQLAFPTN